MKIVYDSENARNGCGCGGNRSTERPISSRELYEAAPKLMITDIQFTRSHQLDSNRREVKF